MIRAGARVLTRLVDRIAFSVEGTGDVSHLVDVRPLQSHEVDIVASELNPARDVKTHNGRLKLQDDGYFDLSHWVDRRDSSESWFAVVERSHGFP